MKYDGRRSDPETGEALTRGVRNITITHKGLSETVAMPGWYKHGSDEGILGGEDLEVSDRALNRLKEQTAQEPIRVSVREAIHSAEMEGFIFTPEELADLEKIASGKISVEESLAELDAALQKRKTERPDLYTEEKVKQTSFRGRPTMQEDMRTIVKESLHTVAMECGPFTTTELADFAKIANGTMTTEQYRAAIISQVKQESLLKKRKHK